MEDVDCPHGYRTFECPHGCYKAELYEYDEWPDEIDTNDDSEWSDW